jgi:hypothetical protein
MPPPPAERRREQPRPQAAERRRADHRRHEQEVTGLRPGAAAELHAQRRAGACRRESEQQGQRRTAPRDG